VQEAFHTAIHKYIVNGEQHWANASDPKIPTALTGVVAGVDTLHNFRKKAMNTYVGQYSETTKQLELPEPDYTYGCGNSECYAVSPYDFAAIYDVQPLWSSGVDGTGQTIAIVGRTDINPNDATNFWQIFGLTVPARKLNIIYNGIYSGVTGDEGEGDIDVQWSGAVAPQATIDFVDSASTEATDGVDLSALYIVDNNLAPVMSESYGQCELSLGTAGNEFYAALWEQAAAQGVSVFVSSGDNGAAGCDNSGGPAQYGLNVNGIASTPFNAAVGGTDFSQYDAWSTYWNTTNNPTTQESAKGYIPETTWNDSCTNKLAIALGYGSTAEQACNNPNMIQAGGVNSIGGSGGPSNCVVNSQTLGSCSQGYAKPSWQGGTGVPNDNLRDLPDVSLFASNGFLGSFYVICQQDRTGVCSLQSLVGYGGTSVASPAFAGIMSLVNQKAGAPQGVPGFALYKLIAKQPNAFHDTPSGSTIAMPCSHGTPNCTVSAGGDQYGVLSGYNTGTGYDLATGLGSVDAANLVDNWTKATFTATTATLQLNSGNAVNVTHGTPVSVNIAVSPTSAKGNASLLVSTGGGTTSGQAIDAFPLGGGATVAGATTSLLPAGTYNVMAHYAGDGNYGGSYSTPVSVTVGKENSIPILGGLTLSGTTTPVKTVSYDSQYWVRADVGNGEGNLCSPAPFGEIACPTGGIIFTDNGVQTNFNTFNLNSEGYTETWVGALGGLTGGTHTLAAQYSGDSNYNASTASVVVTVTKAATNTTPVSSQNAIFSQPVALTTAVQDPNANPILPTPSGTVTFYSNGTALSGTPTYSIGSNGIFLYTTATLVTTFPAPGTYTLTANYAGDQNYQASASSASSLILTYPYPTVSLDPGTQNVLPGGTATVTTLVDTTNKTVYPTGSVTFKEQQTGAILAGPTACASTKDGSGNYACHASATLTVTTSITVLATYSGDANYPPAVSGYASINVPDFSFVGENPVTVTQGESQTVPIFIYPSGGFNGVVSFSCSGLPAETSCSFSPQQITGQGSTTLTIATTPLGQLRKRASRDRIWSSITESIFLLGACLVCVPLSRRRRGAFAVLIVAGLFASLPSCGGGGGGGGGGTNNPVPSVSSLSPASLAAGSAAHTVVINGSGFISGSTVTFNGVAHTATARGTTQLLTSVSAGDLATIGSFPVVVTNPTPGGGSSAPTNFNVVTGTPTGAFTVTVTGTSGSLTNSTTFALTVQ
jgi:hypothetical protein